MYLYPNPEHGRSIVFAKLKEYSRRFAEDFNVSVTLDKGIVDEAFGQACGSATFHRINLADISHYKELAHIGYWIGELKPVRVDAPPSLGSVLEKTIGRTFGPGVATQAATRRATPAEESYRKYASFPISEYLAMAFITDALEAELRRKLEAEKSKDDEKFELASKRFEHFKHVLYREDDDKNTPFLSIVKGLRYHVFTPRSFATLVETVFAFEGR